MEYSFKFQIFGSVLDGMIQKDLPDRNLREDIRREYRTILERAGDIGRSNPLVTSYALAAYFIAMNRENTISSDDNLRILENGMKSSKLLKLFLGNGKQYFSEKKMAGRRRWSETTRKKRYKNDWVVDVIEKGEDFEFGLDYHECGVCKLCWDENCFELAKYLCKLDFLLVEIMGIRLQRSGTLAEGCSKCDFRFQK